MSCVQHLDLHLGRYALTHGSMLQLSKKHTRSCEMNALPVCFARLHPVAVRNCLPGTPTCAPPASQKRTARPATPSRLVLTSNPNEVAGRTPLHSTAGPCGTTAASITCCLRVAIADFGRRGPLCANRLPLRRGIRLSRKGQEVGPASVAVTAALSVSAVSLSACLVVCSAASRSSCTCTTRMTNASE